ncbi:molybdopterin-dependent oxidoreductase [Sporomusa acidovorans]|uniref:Formate dehydrogenase H n=1 Tax=Sporomusa acidovorans (strain ATCC 49682 / DSM 3132 / Mol) TaxID=1123286 RepID=A0ABZ3J4V8_SPOA4|nr:molybdopterin-dependent oxidoreductase [Sporomusa acidovorans]OZC15501.1 formate dehydrogenase H [Sporomusa acidovorans DSM 3132]SDE16273.1 Anaerobic selenocysteine-containing dehydrogenase [Sporomusa acidovorans]
MEVMRSVCPYDCPDTCGLLVHVENGRAIKVEGDPDHPFTRGMLCPKMGHYEKTVHSKRRIVTPLLRSGSKGSGNFVEVSWDEAIERIAGNWKQIVNQHGAEAILPYSYAGTMGLVQRNAGHPFFYRLGASRLERTICSPAKGHGWSAVMGKTMAPHPNEIHKSDLIILWGIHALATDIHIMHDITIARKRGAKVWLIDTYETPTAKVADQVIVVRPGTDGALALGIMHVIARDKLEDRNFISQHVQGYTELQAAVLPDYSPETVSQITGIAAGEIEQLARQYAAAKAPFIRLGSGLSRYGNGAMTVRTITCLPGIVGAWGKPGGGLLAGTSTEAAFAIKAITHEEFLEQPTRIINMNKLGQALNEVTDPPIKSLYVYISNPAAIAPDQNRVLQGLAREDLFTIVHERFMTDTAKYADIVLPATSSLEHSDLYRSYGNYVVQRAYPVIAPVGQAKSNWEVFSLLAGAMEIKEPFFSQSADELIDAMLRNPSPWLAKLPLQPLQAGRPLELPLPDGYKTQFKTPSGKIEILNPHEDDKLPRYIKPHGDDAEFWLINSPDPRLLNSSFNEREELTTANKMLLQMNPEDAAGKGLKDGQLVFASNERGEVVFTLKISAKIPAGIVVAEGVWWLEHVPGNRSVNALTSQRLTDKGKGSTFYDVKVNVKAAGNA